MRVSGSSTRHRLLSRWFPSGNPSDATRLYQLLLGDGQHAFMAHGELFNIPVPHSANSKGLGGGSLINAGVFLEADQETLQMSAWPPEIRHDPSVMRHCRFIRSSACFLLTETDYSRASAMLQPTIYPETSPKLKKSDNLRDSFDSDSFSQVPLTTFFRNARNSTGVEIQANTGSGQECTGLNDGSKNSVATTYLTDAWNWGAEIFCGCEVIHVEPSHGESGYLVHFAWHGGRRAQFEDEFKSQLFWVKAVCATFELNGAHNLPERILLHRSWCNWLNRDLASFKEERHEDVFAGGKNHVWQRRFPLFR